jgi:LacI family transcriptional regulator
LFDRANDDLDIPSVVINDFKGAYIATEHLITQGYQRVAHVTGPQHIKIFNDRQKGYVAALEAYNIAVDTNLIYTGDVSIEAGKTAVDYFFKQPVVPDAIFAVEDFTALGVIKALKEKNVRIPEDFGVIGFANEMFGLHITPSLSTIDQQTVSMGREAIRLLLAICNKTEGSKAITDHVVLEPIPLFRESSMRKH